MDGRRCIDKYLALVPGLILCLVATIHIWRTQAETLSSWGGGGMGMYADINDSRGHVIQISVLRNDWQSAKTDARFNAELSRLRVNPTQLNTVNLAEKLRCNSIFLAQNPRIRKIRIEYLEQVFNGSDAIVRLLRRATVMREPCKSN